MRKNMSQKSKGTLHPTMSILRHAFAGWCKIWGLDQRTCLALTLLLNSRECLMTILWYFEWAEEEGLKLNTTTVVKAAVLIREEYDKQKREGKLK